MPATARARVQFANLTVPIWLAELRWGMTEEERKIVAALEQGEATAEQQREAARILRDLDSSVRELSELNQRA